MSVQIHPTAIVDADAKLAADVVVGPYSIIGPDVVIGEGTRIGPHVVIEGKTTIGSKCEIYQFASVGARPQDLKFRGEPSTLIIGDRNLIREFVTLQPGTAGGKMTTVIGNGNLFMANSHVGHDSEIGDGNIFANSVAIAGHVTIHNHATLGGLSAVHQFVRIGSYAFLSGGSMVGQDIPPYCFGQGDRCHLRGVNVVGLQRGQFSEEEISAVKKVYRILFGAVGAAQPRLELIPSELLELDAVQRLVDFVKTSERGLTQPLRSVPSSDS